MSNIVAMQTVQPLRPRDYSPEQMALIRRTVAADTTPDEFNMFIEVAKRAGLDPFRKQLYCLVYNKDNADKRKVSFITGIDGFRAVAARNGDYRPDDDEPQFLTDPELEAPNNPRGLVKATVKAFKRDRDGQWFPVVGVAYWSEFAPMKTEGAFRWEDTGEKWADTGKPKKRKVPIGEGVEVPSGKWADMPFVMLAKCAEAQALRKGWPEDLSGIYSPEEMDQAMGDVTASAAVEQHEQQKRLALVHAKDTIPIQWVSGEPIEAVPVGKLADKVAEFIGKAEAITQIEVWENINTAGLREFWALHKSDALELKKVIEGGKKRLADE